MKTKPAGKPMEFERDGIVTAIEDHVRELNEFFVQQKLRGGISTTATCASSTMAMILTFFWNMGGRLYSQHFAESYQVMNADKRLENDNRWRTGGGDRHPSEAT